MLVNKYQAGEGQTEKFGLAEKGDLKQLRQSIAVRIDSGQWTDDADLS